MSMVPMRMQMYDPMPLRLGPAVKPLPPPLRMPEPPQHDWSHAQAGDTRSRSMWSPYLSREELENAIKYAPAQSPFDLLGGLTGEIVGQLRAWPKLTDYSLPATPSEERTPRDGVGPRDD